MLDQLSADSGVAWRRHECAPDWVWVASTREIGEATCKTHVAKLYVGPWLGFRVLGYWDDSWHSAKIIPPSCRVVRRSGGLAHRLAEPDSARRR
jgi:hypothetical protein